MKCVCIMGHAGLGPQRIAVGRFDVAWPPYLAVSLIFFYKAPSGSPKIFFRTSID